MLAVGILLQGAEKLAAFPVSTPGLDSQGSTHFSCKRQRINILSAVGRTGSIPAAQLCLWSRKAATGNLEMNRHGLCSSRTFHK